MCITAWCTVARLTVKGLNGLQARIEAMGRDTPKVVEAALYAEANVILDDSVTNYVPYDQGGLANSGKVELPVTRGTEVSVTLGYGADYALDVHENPRAGKTEGWNPDGTRRYPHWARRGEWKYLETPLKAHSPEVAQVLRDSIDAYITSLGNGDTVNLRALPRNVPKPRGNDILEGP